jgi:membrane protein
MLTSLRKAAEIWYDRDADYMAAAVSYFALFAIVPLVFLTVTLAGFLYSTAYTTSFLQSIGVIMGSEVAALITTATSNLAALSERFWLPLFGAVFFSGMVVVWCNTVTSGIHQVWGIAHQGFRGWLRKCWHAVLFIVVFEGYLLALMSVAYVLRWLAFDWWWWELLLNIAFFLVATSGLFALAYRILPWATLSLRARLLGAVTASVLLLLVKLLVTWYLSITPFPGLFEAAGLLVVFVMWVYFSTCVFFYGAAVAHIVEQNSRGCGVK